MLCSNGRIRKGVSVTVESILMIGGILAAMLFFVSFYNLTMYQADNVFSSSEDGFANDLKMKISRVYISRQDIVEYSFNPPIETYKLVIKDRKLSLNYPSREAVHDLVRENISDANIENAKIICIRKRDGIIDLTDGKCPDVCDPNDDVCDEGCRIFDVCDRECNDCEADGDQKAE
ncbi:MAG: hypothetical protein ABIG84_07375 [archaeon]